MGTEMNAETWEPASPVGAGVAMAVYKTSTDRVLVFRSAIEAGPSSVDEFSNLFLWYDGWFLERMKQQLKDNWVAETTASAWTDAAGASVRDSQDAMAHRAHFRARNAALMNKQQNDWLKAGLDSTVNLMSVGYWSLTKTLVRAELAATRNKAADGNVYITGHSQAGARAAMVSMWLEKDDSVSYPTYTFNAPGVQCAVRYSLPAVYGVDMDISVRHAQIKQYVHAMDALGRMDYHPGSVCKYGTTDNGFSGLSGSSDYSSARLACEPLVGRDGASLVRTDSEEAGELAQCQYFTHSSTSVKHFLDQDAILNADGTTDGGCADDDLVPAGDAHGKCPACHDPARCTAGGVGVLPPLALGWQNQLAQEHPCRTDTEQDGMKLEIKDLTGANTQGGRFNKCVLTGGNAKDYLLIGQTVDSVTNTKIFNMATRLIVGGLTDKRFELSLFVADTSANGQLSSHATLMHTAKGDATSQSTLFDVDLQKDVRSCAPGVAYFFSVCLSAVEVVSGGTTSLEYYLSVGPSVEKSLPLKIGTQTGSGIVLATAVEFADKTDTALLTKLQSDSMTVASSFADKTLATAEIASADNFCLNGVANPTAADKRLFAVIDGVEGADVGASSKCVVMGRDSSVRITKMVGEDKRNPPTDPASCWSQMKTAITDLSITLDTAMLDKMLLRMSLNNVASLSAAIAEMKATNIGTFLDEIATCGATNEVLSQTLCSSLADTSIQPNYSNNVGHTDMDVATGTTTSAVKEAIHYAIMLNSVIKAVSADTGGTGVLTDLYSTLISSRPANWENSLNAFEIVKTKTIDGMLFPYTKYPDWAASNAKECCASPHGVAGFRVNVLQAVLEDARKGNANNAAAGNAMVAVLDKMAAISKGNKDIYIPWNMAIGAAYTKSMPFFWAKLVAPSVLCSAPNEFIFHRIVGLFMFIHSELVSRVNVNAPVYGTPNWVNPAFTAKFGAVNRNWADPWLVQTSFPGSSLASMADTVRIDIDKVIAGQLVAATAVLSLSNGVSGTELKVTKDVGGTYQQVPVSAAASYCVQGAAEVKICFSTVGSAFASEIGSVDALSAILVEAGGRRLNTPQTVTVNVDKTRILAHVKGFGGIQSPNFQILEISTPHPCMLRGYLGDEDLFQIAQYSDNGSNKQSCTVLGPSSYLNITASCSSSDACNMQAEVIIDEINARRLQEDFAYAHADSPDHADRMLEEIEEERKRQLSGASPSGSLFSSLTSSSMSINAMTLKLLKSAFTYNTDLRVQMGMAGHYLADLDLIPNSEKCMTSIGFMKICLARTALGSGTLPAGWEVAEFGAGRRMLKAQKTSGFREKFARLGKQERRRLQAEQSVVGLVMTLNRGKRQLAKRMLPLAMMSTSQNGIAIITGGWADITGNEGFDADRVAAPTHDECRHITCPDGEICSQSAAGQSNCYPSMFDTPTGETHNWVQQLMRLAANPYADVISDVYAENGWQLYKRWCFSHEDEFIISDVGARHDCALILKKTTVGGAALPVPICAISFEGSDDLLEPVEPAYRMGTVLIGGYSVWRGTAREYMRFRNTEPFKEWMIMAKDPTICSQVYITGHSLGAGVASLHRLDIEFGRLVAVAGPKQFAPWSYPRYCYGEAFHLDEDKVKATPPGHRVGGLREYTMCKTDGSGNVMYNGCNANHDDAAAPCEAVMDNHSIFKYIKFADDHMQSPTTIKFGACTKKSQHAAIQQCVDALCAMGDPQCALGSEPLRQSLTFAMQQARAAEQLAARIPPALQGRSAANIPVPDAAQLAFRAQNANLCSDALTAVTDALSPSSERKSCTIVNPNAFVLVETVPQVDPFTLQVKVVLFADVQSGATAPQPVLTTIVQAVLKSGPPPAIVLDIYPEFAPQLRVTYKLDSQTMTCRHLGYDTEICLLFRNSAPAGAAVVLDLELAFYVLDSQGYKIKIATADLANPLAPVLLVGGTTVAQPDFGGAAKYLDMGIALQEDMLVGASGALVGRTVGFCNKVILNAFCDYEANGADGCEPYRNAVCMRGGICGCGANQCATTSGQCVASDAANALTPVGHPCVGEADEFKMLELRPDPTNGGPYERCLILGQSSYMRLDYPSQNDLLKTGGLMAEVNALLHVGFSVVPMTLTRGLHMKTQLVLVPGVAVPVMEVSLADSDSNTDNAPRNTRVQLQVPLAVAQEQCSSIEIGGAAAALIPLVDLCIKVSGAGGGRRLLSREVRTVATESQDSISSHRQLVSVVQSEEVATFESSVNTISAALCVPALFKDCQQLPLAYVRKIDTEITVLGTNGTTTAAPSPRQLQAGGIDADGNTISSDADGNLVKTSTAYEVDVQVPPVNSAPEETERASAEEESAWAPPLIVFLCVVCIGILCLGLNCGYVQLIERPNLTNAMGKRSSNNNALKGVTEGPSESSALGGRPSPVQMARKENLGILQTISPGNTWVAQAVRNVPQDESIRKLLLCSFPAHYIRVCFRFVRLPMLSLLPDEKTVTSSVMTPTIRVFLAWRRSVLMVFCGLAFVIIAMGSVFEAPEIIKDVFLDEQQSVRHEDVVRTLTLLKAMNSNSAGSNAAGGAEGAARRELMGMTKTGTGAMENVDETSRAHFQRLLQATDDNPENYTWAALSRGVNGKYTTKRMQR
jgi:hypothetical protein